jgi:hypothetical protein
MPKKEESPKMITLSEVKKRGWTDGLMKSFHLEPDLLARNPVYKCASPMKLYLLSHVEELERSPEFIEAFEKMRGTREKLSVKATARMDKLRKELFEYIDGVVIKLPNLTQDKMYVKAINAYNNLWWSREEYDKVASIDSPKEFLDRISLNYLRHECTQYEKELEGLFGKVGVHEGYFRLKARVNSEIISKYPWLMLQVNESSKELPRLAENRAETDLNQPTVVPA